MVRLDKTTALIKKTSLNHMTAYEEVFLGFQTGNHI